MSSSEKATSLCIILVEKTGTLKGLTVKEFKEEELFKKCGFKKAEDFMVQCEWKHVASPPNVEKVDNETKKTVYNAVVYGKTSGKAGSENKYDFPPPLDTPLLFGTCAILLKRVIYDRESRRPDNTAWVDLAIPHWERIYEKLFGGFEKLVTTHEEDENEEDELEDVEPEKKTQAGYLKDGFVVSSEDESDADADADAGGDVPRPDADADADADADDEVSTNDSSSFNSLSDSTSDTISLSSDTEASEDDVPAEDYIEPDEDADDADSDGSASAKKPAKRTAAGGAKRGKAISKKKRAADAEAIDLSQLECDELVSEGYISTDSE